MEVARVITAGPVGADEFLAATRALVEAAGWSFHAGAPWAHATPPEVDLPPQGWKLHVAATEESAGDVLAAVVPVLLAEGVPFKVAATPGYLRTLNSAEADRASAGKFLTAYPPGDDRAVRVAEAAHRATAGLAGPAILSDRPYRPGSVVHYRYGAFSDRHAVDADGMVVHLLRAPDGQLVPDRRGPVYTAPGWVTDPFQAAPPTGAPAPPGPILLNDRYLVRAALSHANKGGTYLAEDRHRGRPVVIKEGRPHVAGAGAADARDAVRREARMLERAERLRRSPRLVEVFEQGGHVFLVEEHIPAETLRDVMAGNYDPPETGPSPSQVRAAATRLAETMAAFHAAGVVLRDFTPNNVLVTDEGQMVVVDLELAHPVGETPGPPAGTPGYASPEQLRGEPTGLPDDAWSLGATIAYVATGADPYLPAEVGHSWSDPERVAAWMGRHVAEGRVEPDVAALILACMDPDPAERLSPAGVLDALAGRRPLPRRAGTAGTAGVDAAPGDVPGREPDGAAGHITRWLCSALGTGTAGHLWPVGPTGIPLDPVNVQSGASGTGLFLARAAGTLDVPEVHRALSTATAWVCDRIGRGPDRPPGLYFGLAGVAWFLTEAAGVLGRDDLRRRAGELALSLPVRVENPDLSHGTAGVGLAQLHQWLRTGDDRFLARAVLAADHLVRTARRHDGGSGDAPAALTWPVPESTPSRLAGTTSYGFAHGNAGIATFLLYAAGASGEAAFRDVALEALDALLPLAVVTGDAAWWPAGPGSDEYWPHWCNGSSGVGTALVRAHAVTGDGRYLRAAEAAARAGLAERWRSSPVHCHGLAGDAELLLDLAVTTGDGRFATLASEAAASLWLRRRRAKGAGPGGEDLWVFADDTGGAVSGGLGTGMAGVGAFFLRLATGGSRLLTLDELLARRDTR